MNTISTVCGGDKFLRTFQLSDGSIVNCMIYDTAGQERFNSLNLTYFKKADAILLVYDITERGSFDRIKQFYVQAIKDNCQEDIPILLLGNKTDKENKRVISYEEGISLALEENYEFQESCCIKNINVAGAFAILIEKWNFENHKKKNLIKRKNSDTYLKSQTENFEKSLKKLNTERKRTFTTFDKNKEEEKRKKSIKLTKENHKILNRKKKKCC